MVVQGRKVISEPQLSVGESMNVNVLGYQWITPYTTLDSTTDWLIEYGFSFMMWQTILELNHIVHIFVPRQEGSLPPPEKQRNEAWSNLVVVDEDIMGGVIHE